MLGAGLGANVGGDLGGAIFGAKIIIIIQNLLIRKGLKRVCAFHFWGPNWGVGALVGEISPPMSPAIRDEIHAKIPAKIRAEIHAKCPAEIRYEIHVRDEIRTENGRRRSTR